MFALHERLRRWICRTTFLAVGVLPTVVVLIWALWHHTPGHLRACGRQIAEQLDVRVSLAGVSHPRPGATIYRDIQLADPETGVRLLAAEQLRAVGSSDGLLLSAPRIDVTQPGQGPLWKALMDKLRAWSHGKVQLAAGDVCLGAHTLTRVRGRLEPTRAGAQMLISFGAASGSAGPPVRARVLRSRQTVPPSTLIELNTSETPLACSTLWPTMPVLEQLGDNALFRGLLWARSQTGGWQGELAGELTDVDLERLVTSRYARRLGGTAHVVVQRASFQRGRVQAATGSLVSGPGVIGQSLCQAAVESLQLTTADRPLPLADPMPYQQIALRFAINADGLWLRGVCAGAAQGTVLTDAAGPLLTRPGDRPLPVVALVHTLVPRHDVLVPATREAERLTQILPLPESTSSRVAGDRTPPQR